MVSLKKYGFGILFTLLVLWAATRSEAANTMAPYVSAPIFMTNAAPPNVLIIFDNSGSMNQMAYWEETVEHPEGQPWWQVDIVPTTPYDPNRNYYGYFVAGTAGNRVMYSYVSNTFLRDPSGEWEGNFLNWLTMRRADVARKVLVGGLATSRTGGGNTTLIGEDPVQSGRSFKCKLGFALMLAYTPFNDFNDRYVGVKDGYLYVSKDLTSDPFGTFDYKYAIKVKRDSSYADEAFDFHNGNIAGVMQKVGDKAYWGLEFYRDGTGSGENGGYIKNRVGHPTITNLYTNIENEPMQSWTPLAESFYVAMQYFKQQPIDASLAADYNPGYQINTTWDPYNQDGASTHCAKSFVLIFTDGASTKDMIVPDAYKTYDGDSNDPNVQTPSYLDNGSDYLDDIALYARTNDLRPTLDGDQNLEVFVVYAFGDDQAARRLLKDTARNGGFIDKNGNGRPDPATGAAVDTVDYATPNTGWSEWWADQRTSSDGEALPDTYFEAQDGWQLELELINAITKILERANSGTAVSVLATSGEGEGALYQAFFKPKFSTATEEAHWTGYMQGLWIDALGNLREDWTAAGNTAPDGVLNLGVDPIVSFSYDATTGETHFERRLVSPADRYGTSSSPTTHLLPELNPMWEAGSALASRDLSTNPRTIYTFVDLDGDELVGGNGTVDSDEFILFDSSAANKPKLTAYLDLANDPATAVEDFAYLGANESDRVSNLIDYVHGANAGFVGTTDLRNRTVNSQTWRLGDIVHSTPTPVGRPLDNYDLIYGDDTYADYYRLHKNRETVVYAGANDGMLHAFLAGVFNPGASLTGDGASFTVDPAKYGSLGPGDEIWAYIPQNLLPHLKWLADTSYIDGNHVYYVDLKPRIFDARIYEGAATSGHPLHNLWASGMNTAERNERPHGWCTVLVGGMRLGGGNITASGDFDNNGGTVDTSRTFASSYFAIDITDPLEPILLWERTYSGLGFTTSFPAVIKVDERSIDTSTDPDTVNTLGRHWYLVFGSGPTDYDGNSNQSSSIYLVDLATGGTNVAANPGRIFTQLTNSDGTDSGTSLPANGFMGSPASVDLSVDYSVNVSYLGESHESGGSYDGGLYRLQVPVTVGTADGKPVLLYEVDPSFWTLSHMFTADYAVTAAPTAAVGTSDTDYSLWIYFGTGRYLANADKTDNTQQYLYGLKDPHYNFKLNSSQRSALLGAEPLDKTALFDASGVTVYTDNTITGTAEAATFSELKLRQEYGSTYEVGWYRTLGPNERIISKPSVLGGILLAPSFEPNSDVCGFGGDSYLYALYFETGTAYVESVVGVNPDDSVKDKLDLGAGLSSSLGIHVGREQGARGFVQQSTGTINQIDLKPAFTVNSGFVNWREIR